MSDTHDDNSPRPPADISLESTSRCASPGSVSFDLYVSSSELSSNDFSQFSADLSSSSSASISALAKDILGRKPASLRISPYGWYRVLVFSMDNKWTISEVMEQLHAAVMPQKLRYYYYLEEDDDEDMLLCSFYVDSYKLATELNSHRQLSTRVGVIVTDGWPLIKVDEAYKSKLRSLLLSRYDARRNCLDLCFIYADYFKLGDFCVLEQPDCLEAVLEVVEKELPQLRGLILDSNQLSHLDGFRRVERRLPHLSLISLRDNNLKKMGTLYSLQHLPLTELRLSQNPLPCNYERYITTIFPKLIKLDGRMLRRSSSVPANRDQARAELCTILQHFPKDVKVTPQPSPSRIVSVPLISSVQQNVRSFVLRYLRAFDGKNRKENLKDFYREEVMVTLTLARDKGHYCSWAKPYVAFSRQQMASRSAALDMFALWPQTLHLECTLNFDVITVQPRILSITFTGSFTENDRNDPLKHYMRCFDLLQNAGQAEDSDQFLIANELIYLSPTPSSALPLSASTTQPTPEQLSLISKLSAHSRLTLDWSRRFLQQANWDYPQAVQAYELCHGRRQIPDNAFTAGTQPVPEP